MSLTRESSSGANPTYTVDELVHQLKITESKVVFVHPVLIQIASKACSAAGIPADRIVIMGSKRIGASYTVQDLVEDGAKHSASFVERRLRPGEAKTKVACLCLSSGTTGPPKVLLFPLSFCLRN